MLICIILSSVIMNVGIENPVAANANSEVEPQWLTTLRRQVKALRFGVVQVIIHEAQVVQIETTERVRFEPAARGEPAKFQRSR
jgi:hypothetical protein